MHNIQSAWNYMNKTELKKTPKEKQQKKPTKGDREETSQIYKGDTKKHIETRTTRNKSGAHVRGHTEPSRLVAMMVIC